MTKDIYLDMCSQMGIEPIDTDMPVEYADLPYDIQQILVVYSRLTSEFDTNSGMYNGKRYDILPFLLNAYDITDSKFALDIIHIADTVNMEILNKKKNNIKINNGMI